MTRESFIKKWLGNPDKQYTEQFKDEMRSDLDVLISQAHKRITRIKGIEYAPTSFEVQIEIDKGGQKMKPKEKAEELLLKFMAIQFGDFPTTDAKQCALIAVDEIINLEPPELSYLEPFSKSWWQEVKQEIQAL